MTRPVRRVLVALVLVIGVGCTRPPFEPQAPLDAFTSHLDARLPRLMQQYGVPGVSIALVRNGALVWSEAYGYADLEHERLMTDDAVFRAESISKPVTAWGVMRLVEHGLVDLDVPVQRYLEDWKLPPSAFSEHDVTVRRLLGHTAGMPLGTLGEEYAPGGDVPPLRSHLTREARLVAKPGVGFAYSNTGFNVLELLIEEVTGRAFAAYMADEVLAPLGMHRARFAWDETLRPAMPTGYDLQGASVPPYVYPAKASGGLLADVEDVARFVQAEMTGPYAAGRAVLGPTSIRSLHTPVVEVPGLLGFVADGYGLGHFVERLPDGRSAVWHGGQGHGWMTHFHAVPESGDGIVILTNSQRSWPLMAAVLSDWARWCGIGSVKMGRITYAGGVLWVLIGLVILASLGQGYRLVRGLSRGRRRWAPLSNASRGARLLQAALGIGMAGALGWSAMQPYLMVSSVFPGRTAWAGGALFIWTVLLILSAALPHSAEVPHGEPPGSTPGLLRAEKR